MSAIDKLKLKVGGKVYEVEVGDLSGSPVRVVVDGEEFEVEMETESPAPAPASVARLAGASSPVAPAPPAPPVVGVVAGAVTAPMPGKILEVKVTVGDRLSRGDEVCVLEAMKMAQVIRSPRDGVVKAVRVEPGQMVAHGQVLVEFEG